jgi:hypothetical protein
MPNESDEFAQFTQAAIAEVQAAEQPAAPAAPPAPEPPKQAPPADPPKVEQPAAKEPEPAKPVEAKAEPKPEEEVPAWKKAAEAERAKRAAKATEGALQKKLAEVEARLAKFEGALSKADSDPLAAGEALGLSYDKMTKAYIKTLERGDEPAAPKQSEEVQTLVQKIQQIEGLLKQQQQTIYQRAQQEAQQAFVSEVKQTLEAKGDQFKLVKRHPQGPDLVREIRAAHYRETAIVDEAGNVIEPGEIIPIDEACKRAQERLEQFLGLFKDADAVAAAKAEEPKPAAVKPAAPPTLSQDLRQGGHKPNEPHGDEVEQLLLLKKTLEAQLNAQQG